MIEHPFSKATKRTLVYFYWYIKYAAMIPSAELYTILATIKGYYLGQTHKYDLGKYERAVKQRLVKDNSIWVLVYNLFHQRCDNRATFAVNKTKCPYPIHGFFPKQRHIIRNNLGIYPIQLPKAYLPGDCNELDLTPYEMEYAPALEDEVYRQRKKRK